MRYVYFVRLGEWVKVGCSINPVSRMTQLLGKDRANGTFLGCVSAGFATEEIVLGRMKSLYGQPVKGREWFEVAEGFDPLTVVDGPLFGLDSVRSNPKSRGTFLNVPIPASLMMDLKMEAERRGMRLYEIVEEVMSNALVVWQTSPALSPDLDKPAA